MSEYRVTAVYKPKMEKRREKRITAALDRCNIKRGGFLASQVDDDVFPICFSEVDWLSCEDGSETELEIIVDRERAYRVASELRACGMVVGVGEMVA